MCRIAGIIDRSANHLALDIEKMRDAMSRGGPDDCGLYIHRERSLALGHRRLSLIDLTSLGHQPMVNEAESLVLVFNGEIYNYPELKEELHTHGYHFFSHSDTEVILRSYEKWGEDCFKKFKGMFAIALYDKDRELLLLARDHAGIKPLYYYLDKERLYFASEVRSFKAVQHRFEQDPHWKVYFLTFGFLPSHYTTLKGVRQLERGTLLKINVSSLASTKTMFFQEEFRESVFDKDTAMELVRNSLDKAVKRHLLSDAPLGVFLSGGIDSSLITVLAKKYKEDLQTLSINFSEETFSEKKYQDLLLQKYPARQHEWVLREQPFTDALPDVLHAMDQPTADGINSYFICRFAREKGFKAVLSGIGADELFGGYPSFKRAAPLSRLQHLPASLFKGARLFSQDKYRKLAFLSLPGAVGLYLLLRGYFIPQETARLLDMDEKEVFTLLSSSLSIEEDLLTKPPLKELSLGNRISILESRIYMEKQLLRDTDFMSMWHGVEVRVPFLDKDVMQVVHHLSSELKYGPSQAKALLVDSFRERLPRGIWNRRKQGFTFPFSAWMKEHFHELLPASVDQTVHQRFLAGELTWSRYWTYALSEIFSQDQP